MGYLLPMVSLSGGSVQTTLARLPSTGVAMRARPMRTALALATQPPEQRLDHRVMTLADLHGARARIIRVYVVVTDDTSARLGGLAEKQLNGAVVARKLAPRLRAVESAVHPVSRLGV